MCQINNNTENNNGKHLTYEYRTVIAHLYNVQKMNYSEISNNIGCISSEVKKGLVELNKVDGTKKGY